MSDILYSATSTVKDTITNTGKGILNLGTSTAKDFFDFLTQSSVLQLATATIIGLYINDLSKGFVDTIISPILSRGFGKNTKKTLTDFTVTLFGIKFRIGEFLALLFRFIIVIFVLYLFVRLLPKLASKSEEIIIQKISSS